MGKKPKSGTGTRGVEEAKATALAHIRADEYSGHYVVVGPPGTGKTHFLTRQVKAIIDKVGRYFPWGSGESPVMVCSLTRTAAAEIARRNDQIPTEAVGTLHSQAYRSLTMPEVAEAQLEDFNKLNREYRITPSSGIDDKDEPDWEPQRFGTSNGDEVSEHYHLLRARMVPRRRWPNSVQKFAAAWEKWKTDAGVIDFTDMVDFALKDVDEAPCRPRVIIADEGQDHSALEYALLRKWGDSAGAMIIVGDPWQAIFTWRGADPDIFDATDVPEDHRQVLRQSYRVPRAVHKVAVNWVKAHLSTYQPYDYKPRKKIDQPHYTVSGSVGQNVGSWSSPGPMVDEARKHLAKGRSVMFCASCGFFLPPLLAELRRRGVPFANPWRTRRGDWNPLRPGRGISMSQRLASFLRPDTPSFGSEAAYWTATDVKRWTQVIKSSGVLYRGAKRQIDVAVGQESEDLSSLPAGGEGILKGARDMELWLDALAQWFEPDQLKFLIDQFVDRWASNTKAPPVELIDWWFDRILSSRQAPARYAADIAKRTGGGVLTQTPRCYVGTIHSFKGCEADVVFVMPDLSPAGIIQWDAVGLGRDSVVRAFYVALTRAKERLVLCDVGVKKLSVVGQLRAALTGKFREPGH